MSAGSLSHAAGYLERNADPRDILVAAALVFPVFILQQDPGIRVIQVVLFLLLNAFFGKGMGALAITIAAVSITAFNLLIPSGRVLAAPAGVLLTEGALRSGIMKSTTAIGLTALSRLSIGPELRFPGRLGGIAARAFYYFQRIMGGGSGIDRRDPIASIDRLLMKAYRGTDAGRRRARSDPRRTTRAGFLCLAAGVMANWAALAVSLAKPDVLWPF